MSPPKFKTRLEELDYWRGIRLDVPSRKAEAIRNIDRILDAMVEERRASRGASS